MLRATLLLSACLTCLGACQARRAPSRSAGGTETPALWRVYQDALRGAKYVDLTHTITPTIPVWPGFDHPTFGPTVDPKTRKPYTWAKDGFEATRYELPTDQLGTQLDPPAHWSPDYPAIDELPPTFAVRPLVVISIVALLSSLAYPAIQHAIALGKRTRCAQHLRQLGPGQPPQDQPLHEAAEERDEEPADQRGRPEAETPLDQARREVAAQHEEGAVGEVRDPHEAEDQREAGGQQEEQAAQRDAVDGQHEPEAHRGAAAGQPFRGG
jgi:hypothetical protein